VDVILICAGVAIVVVVSLDVVLTTLHPSARGPVSPRLDAVAWQSARLLVRATRRRRALSLAGPFAVLLTIGAWVFGLWLGFALVYLPSVGEFPVSEGVAFGGADLLRALYVSGAALTTVGFGDVVAHTTLLRLVSTLESLAGLAAITAAITYVLSIYPLVAKHRSAALRANDLRLHEPEHAAAVALAGDHGEIEALHGALVELHQDLRRFPVLHYFDAQEDQEDVLRLLRGALVLTLVLRAGLRTEPGSPRAFQAHALEATLRRIMDDFRDEYVRHRPEVSDLDEGDVAGRLAAYPAAVAAIDPGAAHDRAPAEAGDLLRDAHAFVASTAEEHVRDAPPTP
jgi:hypothetical protein